MIILFTRFSDLGRYFVPFEVFENDVLVSLMVDIIKLAVLADQVDQDDIVLVGKSVDVRHIDEDGTVIRTYTWQYTSGNCSDSTATQALSLRGGCNTSYYGAALLNCGAALYILFCSYTMRCIYYTRAWRQQQLIGGERKTESSPVVPRPHCSFQSLPKSAADQSATV